ncbi:putative secreted protein [Penicillium rolfsii]|nr:putative secreted protein [Penicillium rolfsii]
MRWSSLALALLAGVVIAADTTTSESSTTSRSDSSTSINLSSATTVTNPSTMPLPSGSYITYSTTITLDNGNSSVLVSTTVAPNATATTSGNQTITTTSDSVTVLIGGGHTTTLGNGTMNATTTASSTSTQTPIVNTRPCNNYAEFCARNYSNITMVAAHNSPFVRKGNAASNQDLDVTAQLDDGIRMLQFQAHYQNGTMMLCHTSCDILNVGTLEAYLTTVVQWMRNNPYDVVTILIGNYDYVSPQNFTEPIQNSGLYDLAYTPPKIPMGLDDWPTLSEMILTGKRAVIFMDYQANQTAIPWLMDEFSQMWETPFSPTDVAFPCTQQRPPGLSEQDAKSRMYMANHNLNLELSIGSISLLIPNTATINQTNAVNGNGSLGWMANNCTRDWDRPPNFLLVDYYNYGNFEGSVFEVAAEMNNVTYNRTCCGQESAAVQSMSTASFSTILVIAVGVQFFLSAF